MKQLKMSLRVIEGGNQTPTVENGQDSLARRTEHITDELHKLGASELMYIKGYIDVLMFSNR